MARPRQVTDEQILASMRSAVLDEGPSVPLEQVAAELKVSVPALLKRFGSRQALLLAALRPPESPDFLAALGKGPTDAPLEPQLCEMFGRISAFMSQTVPCVMALRESGIAHSEIFPHQPGPERTLKALHQWLRRARERGLVSAPEIKTAAYAILGALQTRAFFTHLVKRNFSRAAELAYVRELARLFTRTLAP